MFRFTFRWGLILLACVALAGGSARAEQPASVALWDFIELSLPGPATGNPFADVRLSSTFKRAGQSAGEHADGFYAGKGVYKIRFMPGAVGAWTWETSSTVQALGGVKGNFTCAAAKPGAHGPVYVRNIFHFGFADGAPFYPFGTTLYGYGRQTEELDAKTLKTLATGPFNKVRFMVLPTSFVQRDMDRPEAYPFKLQWDETWDFNQINPLFFEHLEKRVAQLRDLNIEADLIIFNPYDKGRVGLDNMPPAAEHAFLKYLVARLAPYRNVWWCLCNENSFLRTKSDADWDHMFQFIQGADPYNHLRSIHNADRLYDYTKPWVTHVALQYYNAAKFDRAATIFRDIYKKPIMQDEINYEGDISSRWGQLTGKEMTFRFWMCIVNGTYPTHGETFQLPRGEPNWTSSGGILRGKSPARIAFLRKLVEELGPRVLEPLDQYYVSNCAGIQGDTYLYYFGKEAPTNWEFVIPRGAAVRNGDTFTAEVIDTWEMTRTPVKDTFEALQPGRYEFHDKDNKSIKLPGKPYMAILIRYKGEARGGNQPFAAPRLEQAPGEE